MLRFGEAEPALDQHTGDPDESGKHEECISYSSGMHAEPRSGLAARGEEEGQGVPARARRP
jgi:hypothetical protein